MAIRMDHIPPQPSRRPDDVTIVWKGGLIAKLIFPSGKVVRFDCDEIECNEGGQPEPAAATGDGVGLEPPRAV